jgi:hypothetical protein
LGDTDDQSAEEDQSLLAEINESVSPESDQIAENVEDQENYIQNLGLNYYAGWIAFKLIKKYPTLGDKTSILNPAEIDPWLRISSKGGLIQPSQELVDRIKVFEALFQATLQPNLSRAKGIVRGLKELLQPFQNNLPPEVVHHFARSRIFFRIRYEARLHASKVKARREENRSREARKRKHWKK